MEFVVIGVVAIGVIFLVALSNTHVKMPRYLTVPEAVVTLDATSGKDGQFEITADADSLTFRHSARYMSPLEDRILFCCKYAEDRLTQQ